MSRSGGEWCRSGLSRIGAGGKLRSFKGGEVAEEKVPFYYLVKTDVLGRKASRAQR